MARCTLFFFKGAVMNIRQSRLLKLVLNGVLALSALFGASSAMAYTGIWTSAAIEGGSFVAQPGDFIRYGVTDIPDCSTQACPGNWSFKGFTTATTVYCNNTWWGGDPYPNRAKNCERLSLFGVFGHTGISYELKYVAPEGGTNLSSTVSNNNSGCAAFASAGVPCDTAYFIGWTSNSSAFLKTASLNSSMTCSIASFGGDPVWGTAKYCFFPK